jgi:hypothetical protein
LPYIQFHEWTFLRFVLPAYPWLFIALAAAAAQVTARTGRAGAVAVAVLLAAVVAHRLDQSHRRGVFAQYRGDDDYVGAAAMTHDHTPDASLILGLIHTGSTRYYGGRMTARYDQIEPATLDAGVAWWRQHGVHVYALLAAWEVDEFTQRFEGQDAAGSLPRRRVVTYAGENTQVLFDLSGAETTTPFVVRRTARREWRVLRGGVTVPLATAP